MSRYCIVCLSCCGECMPWRCSARRLFKRLRSRIQRWLEKRLEGIVWIQWRRRSSRSVGQKRARQDATPKEINTLNPNSFYIILTKKTMTARIPVAAVLSFCAGVIVRGMFTDDSADRFDYGWRQGYKYALGIRTSDEDCEQRCQKARAAYEIHQESLAAGGCMED